MKPKTLYLDIETSPILGYVWGLWENNVGLNQIKQDWAVISWAAKWAGNKKTMQEDSRHSKDITNDKRLLKGIWRLLDQADIIITKNGKAFDVKKLNARFIMNDMKPPTSYHHVDVEQIAKKKFSFTSRRLEYLTEKLNTKYKKQKHKKFPGFELWDECLKGNQSAWKEMARYNIYDVLSLEELYEIISKWDDNEKRHVFIKGQVVQCKCGGDKFLSKGHSYTASGKFKRWTCRKCNCSILERKNMLRVK